MIPQNKRMKATFDFKCEGAPEKPGEGEIILKSNGEVMIISLSLKDGWPDNYLIFGRKTGQIFCGANSGVQASWKQEGDDLFAGVWVEENYRYEFTITLEDA